MVELRDSQKIALTRLCEEDRTFAALWAEPRSGKTAVALKWLEHTRARVCLVVAPKVAEAVWRAEASKWLSVDYRFFPLTAGNEYPHISMLESLSILFVNYEQFGKSPFKRLRPFLKEVSKFVNGEGAMILDESHMIKTPRAITGRNIRPLASDWKWRLIMTGTPVTNPSQVDAVYGQWTFLDPSIRDRWRTARDFREHFGEWSTVKGFPELIRPRNQYELNAYLQPNVVTMTGVKSSIRIRKINYELPEEVRTAADTLIKEAVVDIDGHTVAALNPLTRLLRSRQLVAGWCTDDEDNKFTVVSAAAARLGVLRKVLSRTDGKVIIACSHLYEIRLVKHLLNKMNTRHIVITGSVSNKNDVIDRFQTIRSIKVLLVQPRTVSMAVDISVASDLIWYSADFNYVTFKQASDRIKLSPADPTVWFLCGKDSVDEDVWTTLLEDHDHLTKVVRRIKSGNSR